MPRRQESEQPLEPHVLHLEDMQGHGHLDRTGIVYMHEVGWRKPPPDRRRFFAVLLGVLAFHAGLIWLMRIGMRPQYEDYGIPYSGPLSVTLIQPQTETAPPPELNLPPPTGRAPPPPVHLHYEPRAPGSISATLEGVKSPPLRLYNAQGQINVPPAGRGTLAPPAYRAPALKGSRIYSGNSPVPYHATQFDKDWAPDHESIGARAFRRAVDATTREKTVKLPGGIKIKCVASPLVLLFGCGPEAPPPPPKNDDDIRLSMPPAETLTGKKVVLPGSSSSIAPPPASSGNAKPASSSSVVKPAHASSVSPPRGSGA